MSTDGRGTKCRRNIAENFNRLIEQGARALQTDRQTDGRAQHTAKVNVSSRSLRSKNVLC